MSAAEKRAQRCWGMSGPKYSIAFDVAYTARKLADGREEFAAILRCEDGEGSAADLLLVADVLDRGGAYDVAGALRWVLP